MDKDGFQVLYSFFIEVFVFLLYTIVSVITPHWVDEELMGGVDN